MEDKYLVYKHTNLKNGKIYIGITKFIDNPNLRWRNGFGYIENHQFFNDILKYGWENFAHEILETNLSYSQAGIRETYYIRYFNSIDNGYNKIESNGGFSLKTRQLLSKKLKGIRKNPKSIQKQLKTKKDRYGSQRGIHNYSNLSKKVRCIETGDVFASIAEAERWCNSCKVGECCAKKRQHAGKHPITKQLLSWEFIEDINTPITISCEIDRQIKSIKKIQCAETKIIYANASEASRQTGIAACNILRVCHGERKTAGKMHWHFVEEKI